MLWVIHCLDKPDALERRLAAIDAHRAYLATEPIDIVMSGPIMDDDNEGMIGSLFLVNAESREEIDTFQKNDPLYHADVWDSVNVNVFFRRQG